MVAILLHLTAKGKMGSVHLTSVDGGPAIRQNGDLVAAPLGLIEIDGTPLDISNATYFLGREIAIPTELVSMAPWRERLFAFMLRSAASASRFFHLPANGVVEVGSQVEI